MPIGNAGRLQSPAQHYGPSRDSRVRKACSGQSGVSGGYVFFMRDHRLHYIYNYMGIKEFTVKPASTSHRHTLRYEFEPTGAAEPRQEARSTPSRGQLYIDGELVGVTDIPLTVPIMFGIEG
ncbi:MAG: hypothetical protein R2838_02530 [Caldilineaceae bacterium]